MCIPWTMGIVQAGCGGGISVDLSNSNVCVNCRAYTFENSLQLVLALPRIWVAVVGKTAARHQLSIDCSTACCNGFQHPSLYPHTHVAGQWRAMWQAQSHLLL